jgi:hypothetical protein
MGRRDPGQRVRLAMEAFMAISGMVLVSGFHAAKRLNDLPAGGGIAVFSSYLLR